MSTFDIKRAHTYPMIGMSEDIDFVAAEHGFSQVAVNAMLVFNGAFEVNRFQIIQCRRKTNGIRDIRGSCFEFPRQLVVGCPAEADAINHVATSLPRW